MTFGSCPSEATLSPRAHADEAACAAKGARPFIVDARMARPARITVADYSSLAAEELYGSADVSALGPGRTIPRQCHDGISS
ncbi:protein of unknown function [Nitrospira japonica]|uniref:Uncharacterized protein n=1 Tax=Nitrospira japonica TaxID=1325564 RepID=A0A1W1I428_9BACT|nr:protein of unknown function [Nitrospira japonica]